MSFRHRITLVATVAVAVAVLIASALTYLFVADELHRQVDNSLRDTASGLQRGIASLRGQNPAAAPPLASGPGPARLRQILEHRRQPAGKLSVSPPKGLLGQDRGVFQVLGAHGEILAPPGAGAAALPVDARVRGLARSGGPSYFSE